MKPAARLDDPIEHGSALVGALAGACLAAVVAVAIVATAGTATAPLVAVAGATLGGGVVGGATAWLVNPTIETGTLQEGSPSVWFNCRPASAVLDLGDCFIPFVYPHGPTHVVEGSSTVFIECRPAARVGDEFECGAKVADGSCNVMIGGGTSRVVGTRRTWVDTVLDFSSAYLTALGFGFSPVTTAAFAAVGNIVTRAMHKSDSADGAGIVGMLVDKTLTKYGNKLGLSGTREYAMYAVRSFKNLIAGKPIWSFSRYVNNNMVKNNPMIKGTPKGALSKLGSFRLWGLSLGVDLARGILDSRRAKNIPSKDSICCSDQSWLEPS